MVTINSIHSEDRISCGKCSEGERCKGLNPCDWEKYKTVLNAALARYSDRVKYWQVENEPNPTGIYYVDTPQNYAEMLRISYKIIKENYPDCKVVMAGMAGYHDGSHFDYYREVFDSLNEFSECNQDGCFDIFDIHTGG